MSLIQHYMGANIMNPMEAAKISTMEVTQHKVPLVIYHHNCADGFSAAWVFHYMQDKIPERFEFHPGIYNNDPPDVSGRQVYLVDFSYKPDVLKEMLKQASQIWLIDHHKTAIDAVKADPELAAHPSLLLFTDLERSGAMLAWDFWNNVQCDEGGEPIRETKRGEPGYIEPPILLDHVQDRDLWKFKLAGTREIQAAVFSYEYTFENWDMLMGVKGDKTGQVVDRLNLWKEGAAIERKHHKDIAELVKTAQRLMTIGDYTVPVCNLPYTLASDAGHLMAKNYNDGHMFAATYFDTAEHRVFSLRSTEVGMDVAKIAMVWYNGGGHKHAAGFRVPRNHHLAML